MPCRACHRTHGWRSRWEIIHDWLGGWRLTWYRCGCRQA